MKVRVTLSGRAEADLTLQYKWFLDNADATVAERFLEAFDAAVSQLAEHPQLGRPRKFRSPALAGMRSQPVGGRFGVHLIFFRAGDGVLSIERVMHGSRDLPRRLKEPPEL